jgi:hypothetical protein
MATARSEKEVAMATTTVHVRVADDAAARIKELGLEKEFEAMLEHAKQAVPDLRSIEVNLYYDPGEPGEPRAVITAWQKGTPALDDPTEKNWDHWVVRTFSPDVHRWFSFEALSWDNYGR